MSIDWVTMLGNLSRSLSQVQSLLLGISYILGILLLIAAMSKFKKIANAKASSGSHERVIVPIVYLFAGAALIFLRSSLFVLSNTTFGMGNILQYTPYNPYNFYNSILILIKTAGVIWFVRGCILLVHASDPGTKFGGKGLLFLISGILSMNFESTVAALNYIMGGLLHLTHISTGP